MPILRIFLRTPCARERWTRIRDNVDCQQNAHLLTPNHSLCSILSLFSLQLLFLEGSLSTPWGSGGSSINLVRGFCRLADMVFYVYSKPGSTHPRKYINCENLVDIQSGSLAMHEFKLIDKNGREYKLRAANQSEFKAWVQAFQSALARRQRAVNKAIKVWFMDISNVPIVIERGTTTAEDVSLQPLACFVSCVSHFIPCDSIHCLLQSTHVHSTDPEPLLPHRVQLWWLVCEALNLSDESRDAFCIWIMGADLRTYCLLTYYTRGKCSHTA